MMYLEDEYNKAVEKAYQKGATDMEKAKQIIIDKLLVEIEQIRTEVIDEVKYNAELFREIFLEELERQAVDREEILMYRNICSTAWNKYLEQLKENK